jgi:hypothetical protein
VDDFDLPARNRAITQNTDALIVERMPFPPRIGRPENREFFFWQQF